MRNSSYPLEQRWLTAPVPRITIPMLRRCPDPSLPLRRNGSKSMVMIPFLVNFMDGRPIPDRARFWLAYDSAGLHIAGRPYAPDHGRDDVVENQLEHEQLQILLNPNPSKPKWYRIRMRPDRVITIDAGGRDAPHSWWGEKGKLVQRIEEDGWSFVAYVPFFLLGVRCPRPGQSWGMNLFRYEYKRQEDNSSWSAMYLGRTDIPERYGELVFGGKGVCGGVVRARLLPGKSRASFLVLNPGQRERAITLEAWHKQSRIARARHLFAAGRKTINTSFDLPDGGDVVLALRSEGRQVARLPASTGLPALGPRIRRLHGMLLRSRGSCPGFLREEVDDIENELGEVQRAMRGRRQSRFSWQRLESGMTKLEVRASILRHRLSLPDPEVPAAILSTHNLVKVFPTKALPPTLSRKLVLKAPGGGSDSGQLLVFAFDHELSPQRCSPRPSSTRQRSLGGKSWR